MRAIIIHSCLALGALTASASLADAANTTTRLANRVFAPNVHRAVPSRFARRRATAQANCTTDAMASFVGIPSQNDVAGGATSSVTSGTGNTVCETSSAIVSGQNNLISADSDGTVTNSFIGAGDANVTDAANAFIGAGYANSVTGADAFVGAGIDNFAEGAGSFIGGGGTQYYQTTNSVEPDNIASGQDSFIGAGDANVVAGNQGFIGGGQTNTIASTAIDSSIVGGNANTVSASYSGILSGNDDTVSGEYASIAGGYDNRATGEYSAILGGFGNYAKGSYAVVVGGDTNEALGTLSLVGGYHAEAAYNGSFVWSDYVSGSSKVTDTAANQFVVRASGGVYLYSNEAMTSGVELTPGSGTWASLSDRNAKTNIATVDDSSVLSKLLTLPVTTWSYKSEAGVRHVGPMAQDFYAAFGVGADDRHITSIDEDGVALAAAKALAADARQKNREYRANETEIATLRKELLSFEAAVRSGRLLRQR